MLSLVVTLLVLLGAEPTSSQDGACARWEEGQLPSAEQLDECWREMVSDLRDAGWSNDPAPTVTGDDATNALGRAFFETCVHQPSWIIPDRLPEGWEEAAIDQGALWPEEIEANYLVAPNAVWRNTGNDFGWIRTERWDGNVFGAFYFECSLNAVSADQHYARYDLERSFDADGVRELIAGRLGENEWTFAGQGDGWRLFSIRAEGQLTNTTSIDMFEAAVGDAIFVRIVSRSAAALTNETMSTERQEDN